MEPSKQISATSPDYLFIVGVNSTNTERANDTADNEVILGIPLKVEVNLTIYGSGHTFAYFYYCFSPFSQFLTKISDNRKPQKKV